MIGSVKKFIGRFKRKEDGSVNTIEFVMMFPLIFGCFIASTELSVYAIRNLFLERGLDISVRYIRLNTGTPITHDMVKDMICENSGFLTDCKEVLRLEMKVINPRNFEDFSEAADCVDTSEPIKPARGFSPGQQHELMLVRACYMFRPLFPGTGLGYAFEKDGAKRAVMTATNAFVQEP